MSLVLSSAGKVGGVQGFRMCRSNPGVGMAAHNMLTVAVALHAQPEPDKTEPADLHAKMMAYRRLGRWVATGVR